KESQEAMEWLNICAYLHPDQIPEDWLDRWMQTKMQGQPGWEAKSYEVIKHLENYALIRQTEREFSIHGLLQQAIRERQETMDLCLKHALALIQASLKSFNRDNLDTWSLAKQGYIHATWVIEEGWLKSQGLNQQSAMLNDLGNIAWTFADY